MTLIANRMSAVLIQICMEHFIPRFFWSNCSYLAFQNGRTQQLCGKAHDKLAESTLEMACHTVQVAVHSSCLTTTMKPQPRGHWAKRD